MQQASANTAESRCIIKKVAAIGSRLGWPAHARHNGSSHHTRARYYYKLEEALTCLPQALSRRRARYLTCSIFPALMPQAAPINTRRGESHDASHDASAYHAAAVASRRRRRSQQLAADARAHAFGVISCFSTSRHCRRLFHFAEYSAYRPC